MSRTVQLLVRVAPPSVAAVLLMLIVIGGPLEETPRTLGVLAIALSAVTALVVQRPEIRAHATVALAIGAATASGQIRGGGRYALGSAVLVVFSVACLRIPRLSGARAALRTRASLVLLVVTASVAGLLAWQFPHMSAWAEEQVARWIGTVGTDELSGFSTTMRIGSTRGMLLSDRVILRLDGAAPEYLRGVTYDRYAEGRWTGSPTLAAKRSVPARLPEERAATRITISQRARQAPGTDAQLFLPAGACDLGSESGRVMLDASATAHPDPPSSTRVWFRSESCETPPAVAAPPSPHDLEIAPDLRETLVPIAQEWTRGAATDRSRLDALAGQLRGFTYSLDVFRYPELDPVVDFLREHREGHCEHFATALALLARAVGIPARVVGGFHGGDPNDVGGYMVVRERNAHAWVEAWVEGAWQTVDATPPVEGGPRDPSFLAGALDVAAYGIDRAAAALARITLRDAGIGLGALLVVLYGIRQASIRLAKRRLARRVAAVGHGAALPAFDALGARLAARGLRRDVAEPLESFARRLAGVDEPWSKTAAEAIERYAALRYGDEGEPREVVEALETAARAIA